MPECNEPNRNYQRYEVEHNRNVNVKNEKNVKLHNYNTVQVLVLRLRGGGIRTTEYKEKSYETTQENKVHGGNKSNEGESKQKKMNRKKGNIDKKSEVI